MILTDDDRPRIAQHFGRLELLASNRQQHERDIQLARNEQVDETLDVRVLSQRGRDRDRLAQEPAKEAWEERLRDALKRPDAQDRDAVVAGVVQVRARSAQSRVDHLRVVEE